MAGEKANITAKNVIASGKRSAYDVEAVNILKDRQFLARIFKESVMECQEMDIQEIISCIEDLHVRSVPVEPGLTNTVLTGEPTESKIIGEGTITYDIRCRFALRPEKIVIRLAIDLEFQNNEKPNYDLIPRGIFYSGRMLSEQMGHTVTGHNYDKLEKVYSIWIVMNVALVRANTISRYSITHEPVYGVFLDKSRYDLLQVIIIRLPGDRYKRKPKNKPTALMDLLSTVFSSKIGVEEKLDKMQEHGMIIREEMKEKVAGMCNLSEGIFEEGREEGRAEGREEGRAEGENKLAALLSNLFSLGRDNDAKRILSDITYRKLLYTEFHM